MTDYLKPNQRRALKPETTFVPVGGGEWAVLHHTTDSRDRVRVLKQSILGFIVDTEAGETIAAVTMSGPIQGLPILGPEGEVTSPDGMYESLEVYQKWVKRNAQ